MIGYAIHFDNPDVFRSATTAEFSYELIHLIQCWHSYLSGSQTSNIVLFTLHHLPSIFPIGIITGNVWFGDDRLYQQVAFSCLSTAWFTCVLLVYCYCLDLQDSKQRYRYIIASAIHLLTFVYCRFFWFPFAYYDWITASSSTMPYWLIMYEIFYVVPLRMGFNLLLVYRLSLSIKSAIFGKYKVKSENGKKN